MVKRWSLSTLVLVLAAIAIGSVLGGGETPAAAGEGAAAGPVTGATKEGLQGRETTLPLPSTLTLVEYEQLLYPFVRSRDYATKLGWIRDKTVRDTGPYVRGTYYGTHPAVRIYYSPKLMWWLTGNPDYWPEGKAAGLATPKAPREGKVPDGAMIVKEMFHPPAARYESMSEEEITATLFEASSPGWTVMVKDASGAPDGWFWGSVWVGEPYDTEDNVEYLNSGFGLACVRCHATATEGGTFSALRNIVGFPGDPISFFVDETWRDIPRELQPFAFRHGPQPLPMLQPDHVAGPCVPNAEFLDTYGMLRKVCFEDVRRLPAESNDHVPMPGSKDQPFLTSDQCMMCHSGANSKYAFGPIMFLETEQGGLNVSPYGEWRWSPMGLAGRDPVFHAQLESEVQMLQEMIPGEKGAFFGSQVVNTCLRCHGAMGKRGYDHDQGVGSHYWDERAAFDRDWFYITDQKDPRHRYAALARDGISCAICHRMRQEHTDLGDFLANSITGQFEMGPIGEIYGPFEDVIVKPMEQSVGLTPKENPYIKTSRMCGSCHVINLPVVDWPLGQPPATAHEVPPEEEIQQLLASEKNPNLQGFLHRIEQATYLEWLNSQYQDEYGTPTDAARSCQDCHMPSGYRSPDGTIDIDPIQTKIATIEDEDYPEVDHRHPLEEVTVKFREEGFRRHTFQGLNAFMGEMFRQFPDVLGVRHGDFETGTNGLDFAMRNFVQQARESTARVEIENFHADGCNIEADVRVTNLTGHRLPSGVGFRRVFLEFVVFDDSTGRERVLWASGRTNGVGVLVDWDGNVLPEEFFEEHEVDGHAVQRYHEHHQVITSMDQVQVYEDLAADGTGRITTSFIRRATHVKDNRLLPIGWSPEGPGGVMPAAFLHATYPGHETDGDPEYHDGSGSDVVSYRITLPDCYDATKLKVRATLYSQAWAPYFLRDRFSNVPEGAAGDARRRLFYLASHLETEGTAIEGWKLKLTSDTAPKAPGEEPCDDEGKGCG